ncbi:uncharacterized protein [Dermacentor albipictus]|uniref:uncharacterized protein n=1 Tax=Dermacentor albipictus TaxID=60249 RepID=UPI0031FC81DF
MWASTDQFSLRLAGRHKDCSRCPGHVFQCKCHHEAMSGCTRGPVALPGNSSVLPGLWFRHERLRSCRVMVAAASARPTGCQWWHCGPIVCWQCHWTHATSRCPVTLRITSRTKRLLSETRVRIQIANPVMDQMLKDKLDAVRQLLMRWTGVQDVQIQRQDDFDNKYIVVTAMGRDWQILLLEELLLQRWLPQAIDCGDLHRFLGNNGQAGPAKWGSRSLESAQR